MDEKIIKKGFADIQVRVSGILQKHRFTLRKADSAFGEYYFLESEVPIMAAEMMRAASEVGFPLRSPTGMFFPKGTGPKDFAADEKGAK